MNTPQQVTSRYVRNLIFKGVNNEFRFVALTRTGHFIDQVCVGMYYEAIVANNEERKLTAVGVTPEQAVHRCLEKHGVTFR